MMLETNRLVEMVSAGEAFWGSWLVIVQCFIAWGLSYCSIFCRKGHVSLCIYPQY